MRILLVKTSSLGDVVHCCPAVSDARRHLPGAQIDWVVEAPFAPIAAMHPGVSKVITVAVRRWRKRLGSRLAWQEMRAFRKSLRAQRYDAVIDAQGLLKSALIARNAHGTRHGYDSASARESLASRFYDTAHRVPRALHAVERNRRLIALALGFDPGGDCDYGLRPPAVAALAIGAPYCVLLSMTSRGDKLWASERWVELVRLLAARGWESILPWGSQAERARCEGIVRQAGAGRVPPALTLAQLGSLFQGAHAAVGVDTGLTHFAAALGIPTVGVFCGSDPALTGLYGSRRALNLGGAGAPPTAASVYAAIETPA